MSLWTTDNDAKVKARLHPGQARAWRSDKRLIAVTAGTQSGKTSFGPLWLKREIDRRGAGDYLAGTASYDMFKLKMLPAIRETFEHVYRIGRYWAGDRVLEIRDPVTETFLANRADDPMYARVILRSADAPGGWESSTARAGWLDEVGLSNFTLEIYEAIMRRLALAVGRLLMTTTVYGLGWLKRKIYDPWKKARRRHPDIDVIQFDSIENPTFPRAEWERARRDMPAYKFNRAYRGFFDRPTGLIFDVFEPLTHAMPRFPIPDAWQRYVGLDFGGANTAAVFWAEEPCKPPRYYAYREYWPRVGRTAKQHVEAMMEGEPRLPTAIGGSSSEDQWRSEFSAAGLSVREPPVKDVEVGIQRAYAFFTRDQIRVFDDLEYTLAELENYGRVLDDTGEPTDKIKDKEMFHLIDGGFRYLFSWLEKAPNRFDVGTRGGPTGSILDEMPSSTFT